MSRECICCDAPIDDDEAAMVRRVWETRLDGYCHQCALQRCDAFPGQHRFGGSRRVGVSEDGSKT